MTNIPTDYVDCMIAAGWLSPADVDAEYLDYCRKAPFVADGDVMDYQQWQSCKRLWDELNAAYMAEVQPHYNEQRRRPEYRLPEKTVQRQNYLLREMSFLEVCLGY